MPGRTPCRGCCGLGFGYVAQGALTCWEAMRSNGALGQWQGTMIAPLLPLGAAQLELELGLAITVKKK